MFHNDTSGIKIAHTDFWLDAKRKVSYSFVSHGHADHLKSHTKILATPPTVKFHAIRNKQRDVKSVVYGETIEHDDMHIKLFPSGHILGSAMIQIERDGQILLYTGDLKLRKSLTADRIQIPEADILIMESTYGHPDYIVNRDQDSLIEELMECITCTIQEGLAPIVLAYNLGKAQEAMKILGDAGFQIRVHPTAWSLAQIYQEFGITFNNCFPWDGLAPEQGVVLIIPPHLARSRDIKTLSRRRAILLSGWANRKGTPWFHYDHAIPFSDHADYNELIEFAQRVNPKKIFTTHGFPEFPDRLKRLGFNAEILSRSDQISLF